MRNENGGYCLFVTIQRKVGVIVVSSSLPISLDKLIKIEKQPFKDKSSNPGDILIMLNGPKIGTVFRYDGVDSIPRGVGKVVILQPDLIDTSYLLHILRSPRFQKYWKRYRELNRTLDHHWLGQEVVQLPNLMKQGETVSWFQKAEDLLRVRQKSETLWNQVVNAAFLFCFGDPFHNPKGFQVFALGDVITVNPSPKGISIPADQLVPYIKMEDLSEVGISKFEYRMFGKMQISSNSFFSNGDVLFPKISPSLENGKGCVVSGLDFGVGYGSSEFFVLRPIENISHAHWIHYLLKLPVSRNRLAQFLTGSVGYRRIPMAILKSWKVPLPPIEIQRKFSAFVHSLDVIRLRQDTVAGKMDQMLKSALSILS